MDAASGCARLNPAFCLMATRRGAPCSVTSVNTSLMTLWAQLLASGHNELNIKSIL